MLYPDSLCILGLLYVLFSTVRLRKERGFMVWSLQPFLHKYGRKTVQVNNRCQLIVTVLLGDEKCKEFASHTRQRVIKHDYC